MVKVCEDVCSLVCVLCVLLSHFCCYCIVVGLSEYTLAMEHSQVEITPKHMRPKVSHRNPNRTTAYKRIINHVSLFHLCQIRHQECKLMICRRRPQIRPRLQTVPRKERLSTRIRRPARSYSSPKEHLMINRIIQQFKHYIWLFQCNLLFFHTAKLLELADHLCLGR
jgi:hypothetical protein